jgi:hypothetical protein
MNNTEGDDDLLSYYKPNNTSRSNMTDNNVTFTSGDDDEESMYNLLAYTSEFLLFYAGNFLIILLCCAFAYRQCANNDDVPTDGTLPRAAMAQDEEDSNKVSLTEKIQKLSTDDRYQYYSEVLNKNGSQIKLVSNQIITINKKPIPGIEDDDEESSIYLSLDSVWNSMKRKSFITLKNALQTKNAATVADCSSRDQIVADVNDKQIKRRSSFLFLSSTKSKNGNINRNNIVSGNCVICFENFKKGDTIVYNSETKNCPHIYHKDCMVDYLVSRKIFKEQIKNGEEANPSCPTCRRTFCKLTSPGYLRGRIVGI